MKIQMLTSRTVCLLLFLVVSSITINAQQGNSLPAQTPAPTTASSPAPVASPSPRPSPKVIGIIGHLELDDIVQVQVENFDEWADTHDPAKLVPFIDGRAVRGNYPEEIHPDQDRLHFHLELTPENKELWTDLLGAPAGTRRPVAFTIGLETESPFDSVFGESNQLPLTVISHVYGLIALVVVLFTLVLFLWLARKTNIIREGGSSLSDGRLRPYNLGRSQMAFWFFLIYVSYLVIWLITGALDTITGSLLALMGISAGTALGEAMIDTGKEDARSAQLQQLLAEKQALEQSVPDVQSQLAQVNAKTAATLEDTSSRDSLNKQVQDARAHLAQVTSQIDALTPSALAGVSRGFIKDILSDAGGYSFHRFQIFAWTIILGVIFISSVYNSLNMPEFSATLLGLMGLSSGTYIGFKFPEQK